MDNFNFDEIQKMPYSLESEQSILGCMLIDSDCVIKVISTLKPDSFYHKQHKQIAGVIFKMFNQNKNIDLVTTLNEVILEKVFDTEQNAKMYLAQLMELVPSISNLDVYCNIVKEKYYVRTLIDAAQNIMDSAINERGSANDILDNAEQKIFEIRQGRETSGLIKIDEIILGTYDHLQKITGDDKHLHLGISSGFTALDTVLTGLNPSDLILIASRPAMGKTSFAMNIASYVGKKSGKQVAVFSLEMSKEQLVSRMLSSEAQVSSKNLRSGNLDNEEWARLASGAEILSNSEIYIDDTPGISVGEMKAKLRRMKNLGLVIIDYLQLMSSGGRRENRVQEVSEITRHLKIMAKELNVPIISLSQLSRGPDTRADHRPMLSDLRESGSIEQDADAVMFLYREAYYTKEPEKENLAECIVAKNRHGEIDSVQLAWDGRFTRFANLEMNRYEPDGY